MVGVFLASDSHFVPKRVWVGRGKFFFEFATKENWVTKYAMGVDVWSRSKKQLCPRQGLWIPFSQRSLAHVHSLAEKVLLESNLCLENS